MDSVKQILINITDSIPTIAVIPRVIIENKPWFTSLDFSIIISIVIFFMGFIISRFIEKNKKRKELELYKLLVVEWVNDSKKSIDHYVKYLEAFAKKVKSSDSLNSIPYQTNRLCLNKLNALPIEKLTDALFINLQIKPTEKKSSIQLFNLINQLDFLDKNIRLVTAHNEKYYKENEGLLHEWNTHLVILTKNIVNNYNDKTKTEIEDKFYEYSLTLQKDIINLQKQNAEGTNYLEVARSIFMSKYINPINKYGINDQKFANSQRIQMTMNLLRELTMVNLKYNNLVGYGNDFENMNFENIKAQTILFKSIAYYESHKIKSFWKIK